MITRIRCRLVKFREFGEFLLEKTYLLKLEEALCMSYLNLSILYE